MKHSIISTMVIQSSTSLRESVTKDMAPLVGVLPLAAIGNSGNNGDVVLGREQGPQRAVPRVDQRECLKTCTFNTKAGEHSPDGQMTH